MSATCTVLVADDDALFRDAVALTLRDDGYEVVTADSAAAGARVLAETRVDLVVADIAMQGNHRLEWLRDLARLAPDVPVVVVTGAPSIETAAEAVRLPVVAYLLKPVEARVLRAEVSRALAARGTRADAHFERLLAHHRHVWQLTDRQAEALALVVRGASNKGLAEALACATRTAELHVTALLEKSGQPSRAALIATFWSRRDDAT
jgi:DNA-binding NarL/FixJ family response regulator